MVTYLAWHLIHTKRWSPPVVSSAMFHLCKLNLWRISGRVTLGSHPSCLQDSCPFLCDKKNTVLIFPLQQYSWGFIYLFKIEVMGGFLWVYIEYLSNARKYKWRLKNCNSLISNFIRVWPSVKKMVRICIKFTTRSVRKWFFSPSKNKSSRVQKLVIRQRGDPIQYDCFDILTFRNSLKRT